MAGEDLKKYLIVPTAPVSSSSSSSSAATQVGKSQFSDLGTGTGHEHFKGQHSAVNASESAMNIDTPMLAPASGTVQARENVRASPAPLPGIMSMDDFMNQYKDEHEAERLTREQKNSTPTRTAPTENATSLTPIAVGARSSKNTILLHEKYQALGIAQPLFTYGGGSGSGWTATLSFPGLDAIPELQGITDERTFNSKQEAKEALSEKGLAVLEDLEQQGRVKKATKSRKSTGGQDGQLQPVVDNEPAENYVGKLLEFQRATNSPQPTYTDYASGTRFTCLVTFEGSDQTYGSLTTLFTNKKAARQAAACAAIQHFKDEGIWPEDVSAVGGIRKKKAQAQPSSSSASMIPTPLPPSGSSSTTPGTSTGTSFASRAASLSTSLSLPTPEWLFTPHPSDPSYHTVSCIFRGAGPPHEGPIGEVRNVFGKKRAKEECARLVVEYLEGVRERRREEGRRMMEGVKGGEGVVSGGGGDGRVVEGEREEEEDVFMDAAEG